MSHPADDVSLHDALQQMADRLFAAAAYYRSAWRAQRGAMDALNLALEGSDAAGTPAQAAAAVRSVNHLAERAQLLTIPVDDQSLRDMEEGVGQLEDVALAAQRVAQLLAHEGNVQ